ncbi:peroxiredoxin [Pelagibacterales bacterium SAG-MED41]|nr:peroxiredoxin [Pelagibacterales bacterium SAG-MED41]|tara:strand:- start:962 stop:1423 length:462 start_codon:yes stop_codon:yes gene_type:complete
MKIKKSIKAPSFKLPSTGGVDFNLKNIKGKLLIYFYPKDDTPGCTIEAKDFSKLYKKFKKIKCELVGVSKDSIQSHEKFKKKYKVPFKLLSDPDVKMQKKYDVWGIKSFMGKKFLGTIRSTVFIDKGKIKRIWTNVRVKNHANEVFEYIKLYK